MKKLFTLFAAVAISSAVFAQRNSDFKLDSIYAPFELNTPATGSTPFSILFQCSNNGFDTIPAGDSIFYNFAAFQAVTGTPLIVSYPAPQNPNSFGFGAVLTKDLFPGDTVMFTATGFLGARANITNRVIGQGGVYILNRSAGQNFANDTVSDNNRRAYFYTWFNPEKWPLSVENMEASPISVYPNPAVNTVTIQTTILGSEVATINVYDIKGQLVSSEQTGVNPVEHKLNVSSLTNGVYIVEVKSGTMIQTSKLVVNH